MKIDNKTKNRIIKLLNDINFGIHPYRLSTPEEKIEYIIEKVGYDEDIIRKIAVDNGYKSYSIIKEGK